MRTTSLESMVEEKLSLVNATVATLYLPVIAWVRSTATPWRLGPYVVKQHQAPGYSRCTNTRATSNRLQFGNRGDSQIPQQMASSNRPRSDDRHHPGKARQGPIRGVNVIPGGRRV